MIAVQDGQWSTQPVHITTGIRYVAAGCCVSWLTAACLHCLASQAKPQTVHGVLGTFVICPAAQPGQICCAGLTQVGEPVGPFGHLYQSQASQSLCSSKDYDSRRSDIQRNRVSVTVRTSGWKGTRRPPCWCGVQKDQAACPLYKNVLSVCS
jgi:hypothetical protein